MDHISSAGQAPEPKLDRVRVRLARRPPEPAAFAQRFSNTHANFAHRQPCYSAKRGATAEGRRQIVRRGRWRTARLRRQRAWAPVSARADAPSPANRIRGAVREDFPAGSAGNTLWQQQLRGRSVWRRNPRPHSRYSVLRRAELHLHLRSRNCGPLTDIRHRICAPWTSPSYALVPFYPR